MAIMPRPLSIPERKERAEKLRQEAEQLIEEAKRIEAGVEADLLLFTKMVEKAIEGVTDKCPI